MTRSICAVMFVAMTACGAKSPPPANDPPPVTGSATTPPPAASADGAVCGTRGAKPCAADEFCSYAEGAGCGEADKPGHCMKPPEVCAEIFAPVCGCDGKTHPNECHAAFEKTGVRDNGACK